MANEEKTKEDHPFSLPASDPVNTTVFDSPAVKHKLPLYLQNILSCGYDTLDAIAELNVHESGLNDIDKMLEYVNNTFPQDQLSYTAMYMCSWLLVHTCRFHRGEWARSTPTVPPGHRILICKFVEDVQRSKFI